MVHKITWPCYVTWGSLIFPSIIAGGASEPFMLPPCISKGPVRLRRHMQYEGLILELIWSPHMIWRLLFGRYGDFFIWSSSISAAASNPQAIPYIVVELKLLAPDQSHSEATVSCTFRICTPISLSRGSIPYVAWC